MTVVGLTGGIGSGKSAVAELLSRRGAAIIDADELAHLALAVGSPGFDAARERFGEGYLGADGSIDRGRLAALVFSDEGARADLEAIVHPVVEAAIKRRLDELSATADVIVVVIPLLIEKGRKRYDFAGVLLVDAPEELALERLVTKRKMDPDDARARLGAQASRRQRMLGADFVIMNMGTLDELAQMTDNAWQWIESLEREPRD